MTNLIEADTVSGYIVFSDTVATGESAVITYKGLHRIPTAADDDAQITVPESHWEALVAFVDFRSHWQLESTEAATLATVTIILSQLGQEGRIAWRRYKEIMDRLHYISGPGSVAVNWGNIGL